MGDGRKPSEGLRSVRRIEEDRLVRIGRVLAAAVVVAVAGAGTAEASFTQEPGSPVHVGLHPALVFAADFNADTRPDLLSVEESTMSVLLRKPTGGYELEAGSPRAVGAGPSGAAIADFNGDSLPDVAVSNFVDQNVVVLLRQPGGGFAALGAPIALGFRPGAIATGDFAGDAAPDLAVTNWDGTGVRILQRQGAAFTLLPAVLPTGGNPRYIAIGDFDGVGGADLAVTNSASSSLTVLLRQGATFTQETGSPFTVGTSPQRILVHDFNGDGRPDLALANFGDDNVRLLLRQPGGGFANAPGSPFGVGDGPVDVAGGDFNSDGLPDFVASNQNSSTASVLLRTGAGGFAPDPSSPVATDTLATGVTAADINADGRADIAVANYTDNSITILLNTTPPPPAPPPPNLDSDGDGVQRPTDCNDNDARIHPGAKDKPGDKIDQDCNGRDARFPVGPWSIEAFSATYPSGYTQFTSMKVTKLRPGDRLRLTCKGPGCEKKKKRLKVRKKTRKLSVLRHLKGAKLRKGSVVQLRVTRPATIGRVGTWKIRAPKVPKSTRTCLRPGAKKPSRCPR
jgi:hypothetical protein